MEKIREEYGKTRQKEIFTKRVTWILLAMWILLAIFVFIAELSRAQGNTGITPVLGSSITYHTVNKPGT
jgi:preprotein translocase subunit SecG